LIRLMPPMTRKALPYNVYDLADDSGRMSAGYACLS
jgi:hypothetical protein